MKTTERQILLCESNRVEITGILNIPSWDYQRIFSVSSFQPIIVLYGDEGAKVAVAEYQDQTLIQYTDASSCKKHFYFAFGNIILQ